MAGIKDYSYTVIFEPLERGGYQAVVPALPEIITAGRTQAAIVISPQRHRSREKIQKPSKLQILPQRNQILATADFREKGFFLTTAEFAEKEPRAKPPSSQSFNSFSS